MKRVAGCLCAIFVLLFVAYTPCSAISARWNELDTISGSFNISSTGKATFKAKASSFVADAMEVEVSLQQDGEEIKSWSAYADDVLVEKTGSWYVDKGHHYQIVITAHVYVSGEEVDSGEKVIEYEYL